MGIWSEGHSGHTGNPKKQCSRTLHRLRPAWQLEVRIAVHDPRAFGLSSVSRPELPRRTLQRWLTRISSGEQGPNLIARESRISRVPSSPRANRPPARQAAITAGFSIVLDRNSLPRRPQATHKSLTLDPKRERVGTHDETVLDNRERPLRQPRNGTILTSSTLPITLGL